MQATSINKLQNKKQMSSHIDSVTERVLNYQVQIIYSDILWYALILFDMLWYAFA
jgi:hypothetical protein